LKAARVGLGNYSLLYFPLNDQTATIDLGKLSAKKIRGWWYDPRTGVGSLIGESQGGGQREFRSPPQGPDWVLVLDDSEKNYAPPGLAKVNR